MKSWESAVYAAWEAGQRLSAVGPGPVAAHLEHARGLSALIPADASVGLDLGCGAGVPGLALAGLRPEMRWILLDASLRRIRLVQETVRTLEWIDRVDVVHGRAEDVRALGFPAASVVTARLFGPPATTAECAAPFLAEAGRILVTEPPASTDGARTDRWSAEGLRPLGLVVGARHGDPAVQVLHRVEAAEPRFPRKAGVARKRPLW